MQKHIIAKLALFLFAIAFFSMNTSGIAQNMSIRELTMQADLVVMGTVISAEFQWEVVNGESAIFTYVCIDVETYIRGFGVRLIDIKVPGAAFDEITQSFSDAAQFTEGERIIVFLSDEYEYFQVVGWNQGKFTIEDDKVVGLGEPVNEFITMIQRINIDETPENAEPCIEVLDMSVLKPTVIKDEPKKEISDKPVLNEGMRPSATTIMSENFESGFPTGLWMLAGVPTWDDDDYKPHSGSNSAWCAASTLDPEFNNYPNNMDGWMIYGPFDLSDAVDAELLYYYWNISETDPDGMPPWKWDLFCVYASADSSNWSGYGYHGNSGGWKYNNFDLTNVPVVGNLCGDSSVWIAFRFDSDYSNTYQGAFVDDIVLQKIILEVDLAAGQGPGAASYVRDFAAQNCAILKTWKAFGASNATGEVSVAKGNVTGNDLPEIVVGQRSSTGANSYVRVFSQDGTLLWTFQAFGAGNVNGMVNVAVGDVDLDGYGEIIVGQGPGGQSYVRIFEYGNHTPITSWQAFGASNVNGEVRVAAGHTVAAVLVGQIITGQGHGGQSYVRVWDYASPPTLRKTFQAFGGANTSGGVDVGVGNFDSHASSRDLIVVGQGGPGGTAAGPAGSYVRIFAGNGALLKTIKAFGASNTKGRVTVSGGQADTDAADEIIVGQAVGGASYYRTFNYDGSLILTVKAFGASNTNGQVDVAGYRAFSSGTSTSTERPEP